MMRGFADLRWAAADGLSLYARIYEPTLGTSGLPIVCLHGLTRNSRDFELIAPWLADRGHRVLVPEMRGRGRSDNDPVPANYVHPIYVRDVLALLEQEGVAAAIFIGTSMGGVIATILGEMATERVAGVILNDVGPEVDRRGVDRITSYVGKGGSIESWDDAAAYVARINSDGFLLFGPDDWTAFARRTFREDNGKPVLDYDPAIARPFGDAGAALPDPTPAWESFSRLAATRPVLVLRGAVSDILSRETAERMERTAATVELVEIADVGHAPTMDEEQSRRAIEQWLVDRF